MSDNNPFQDRTLGEMGLGSTKVKTDLATDGKKLDENCDGWTSKSFTLPLASGTDPYYCYPDEVADDSGPAWPSNSKS